MIAYQIRRATADDAAALAQLARRTFVESYASLCDEQAMRNHCDRHFGEAQQRAEILDPHYVVLLLYVGEELVGLAQVVRRTLPACLTQTNAIALQRYYLLQTWQGKGLGQALLNAVIEAALSLGGVYLWLSVWEKNPRAIAYYLKAGFACMGETGYLFDDEMQTDLVMLKQII
ncbi:MAG: GNAT family N-acetyltransferase [Undibacterium sp.]|nr:GNAT family N-acetyltransferase [Undibacterium sp.]